VATHGERGLWVRHVRGLNGPGAMEQEADQAAAAGRTVCWKAGQPAVKGTPVPALAGLWAWVLHEIVSRVTLQVGDGDCHGVTICQVDHHVKYCSSCKP
jgi:hypothetical protein